ncbi:hypothetical protein A3K86_20595 [Photobacterium jeanii]|uniref:Ammonia monooxygenase n=1 Tax=Photobacterium jeanii TaxID=858640 RepID=A0A178K242_9GAMM|nr:AbrB family transcriptional regulator [Photobacterium jeanii]OAN11351.1 hypothetical protein A3K86_20595 [Photobacterium jeanii]PST90870.1 hypothetical protein C9I91_09700 [Photobacterium jeanii]
MESKQSANFSTKSGAIITIVKTCALTIVGALLGRLLPIPMGEMFGALTVVFIASKLGHRMQLPPHNLTFIQIILGISVGNLVDGAQWQNGFSIGIVFGLFVCMAIQTAVGYFWLRRREGWSRDESLLGAVPGAMAAVIVMTDSQQMPAKKVIFTHTVRLVSLMILAAALASFGETSPAAVDAYEPNSAPMVISVLGIGLVVVVSLLLGRLLEQFNVPAPYMLTGMLISAVTALNFPEYSFALPDMCLMLAMALLGALVAVRVQFVTLAETCSYLRAGMIILALGLGVTFVVTGLFSWWLEIEWLVLIMAWVPGSIEAMTVTALLLGLEPTFVMLNHIIRLTILHALPALILYRSR